MCNFTQHFRFILLYVVSLLGFTMWQALQADNDQDGISVYPESERGNCMWTNWKQHRAQLFLLTSYSFISMSCQRKGTWTWIVSTETDIMSTFIPHSVCPRIVIKSDGILSISMYRVFINSLWNKAFPLQCRYIHLLGWDFPTVTVIVITLACLSSKLHLTPPLRLLQSAVTEFLTMALV